MSSQFSAAMRKNIFKKKKSLIHFESSKNKDYDCEFDFKKTLSLLLLLLTL